MNDENGSHRGLIAWFARNHVAANVIFVFVILTGALSLLRIQLEVFPDVQPDLVTVRVPYPGATPQEVEDGILLRVEDAVADVEGIEEIEATALENLGIVTIEIEHFADNQEVLDDVKSAVDRIDDFPIEAEEPVVSEPEDRTQVLTLALYGDVSRITLKELAKSVKEDLIDSDTISTITIDGLPPYEVSIEVDEAALRRYGLTFSEVAEAVSRSSLDLPAGTIDTGVSDILIRTGAQAYYADAFAELPLLTDSDGAIIRVGDVADVLDTFEDNDFAVEFDGKPAALLNVFRIGREEALRVRETVQRYLDQNRPRFPPGVDAAVYNDQTVSLRSRIRLLLENAAVGLALVLLLLGLFLELRLALWVGAGLVMAFVGSLAVLPLAGAAVHQISLFAFILILGIVVDDAIVVGENIYRHREEGQPWSRAVVTGTKEVAVPVVLVVLSTILAFLPMLFVRGEIGKVLFAIPIVVISVLLLSLVEALLVLPSHLDRVESEQEPGRVKRGIDSVRQVASDALEQFIKGPFKHILQVCLNWRYVVAAVAASVLWLTGAFVSAGLIEWSFFPDVQANRVVATLEMRPGTSAEQTLRRLETIVEAGRAVEREVESSGSGSADDNGGKERKEVVRHIQVAVGGHPMATMSAGPGVTMEQRDPRLGEVVLELVDAEARSIATDEIASMWRDRVGPIAGAEVLTFDASLFTAGRPIFVRLGHDDFETLEAAAEELKRSLNRFEGVREITDSFIEGKPQVEISGVTALGASLGFRTQDVARQVRSAFFGFEAQRVQRGRDEVRVYVRYPERLQSSVDDIASLHLRSPDPAGAAMVEAPLSEIAEYRLTEGVSQITRSERERVIDVTADVNRDIANAAKIKQVLRDGTLAELRSRYPGLEWTFEGENESQRESLRSLGTGLGIALVAIYALMAALFRSYLQPIIIFIAIPFGVVGAIVIHYLLGFFRPMPLSFMSVFGIVALTGVVVNDALILIDLVNRLRAENTSGDEVESADPPEKHRDRRKRIREAVQEGTRRRCRPILLTTVTTFFALIPMIFETSLQAQFLVPMAASLGFGVLFASGVTLLLVPSAYLILEDIRGLFIRSFGTRFEYE